MKGCQEVEAITVLISASGMDIPNPWEPFPSVLQTRVERPFDQQLQQFFDLSSSLKIVVRMEVSFIPNREL
jgi:hypothetical protein